ncbi:MAG: hypothetical protein L0323_14020 [Planctomycetes bacterium]|nr:hypothetical protein [Planctomycetota bacterium]
MKETKGTVVEARTGSWGRLLSRGFLPLALLASGAGASDVVVPSAWTATQGPDNNSYPLNFFSPGGVGRYQQVYAASDFLASGVAFPIVITGLSFRPGQAASSSYSLSGRTLTVTLTLSDSTAGPDALSPTFAANVSGTATTVYSGALVLPTVPPFPGPGPHPFVWTIPLQSPFLYTGASDLLLDLSVLGSTAGPGAAPLDGINANGDAVSRQFNQGDPFSPTANGGGTLGLITRVSYDNLFAPFGAGCAGAGGFVPSIGSSGGDPTLGNSSFAITLANATGGGAAFLVVGASDVSWLGVPLPLALSIFGAGPGCFLLVSGDVLIGTAVSGAGPGAGSAVVPTPIPANPALSGGIAFVQWIPFDPILAAIHASNAASVTLF